MIPELLAIEYYLGRLEAVMPLEAMVRTFGRGPVRQALADNDLEIRFAPCHVYACLSEKARMQYHDAPVPPV
jgi:hypothetical protein